ncbi:MAG: hypothetical protein C3F13_18475 [Anaerolineales bacterium]|nr:hypothetical protein [Anaerolineae bacterium]PWB49824.1 MAG: hypothetical protein C3F13_18475 [Anaerolineales bacterium]
MPSIGSKEIMIAIDSVDQLFNESAVNPFSSKPIVVLGEAGLPYAIRQTMSHDLHSWRGKHLVIQLPADQITPELQEQLKDGILRYARAKIEQNDNMIHLSRLRSLVGLCIAILIAAVLLGILALVSQTLLASASDVVIGIVAGLVTIFIWSTVWNPWDRLVYEWIEPWLENRILRCLMTMEIVVQPEPAPVH